MENQPKPYEPVEGAVRSDSPEKLYAGEKSPSKMGNESRTDTNIQEVTELPKPHMPTSDQVDQGLANYAKTKQQEYGKRQLEIAKEFVKSDFTEQSADSSEAA